MRKWLRRRAAISSACSAFRPLQARVELLKYLVRFILYLAVAIGVSCARAGSYEDFFIAVANDDEATVSTLLARGFDPNTVGPQRQMPLHAALHEQSLKVAEALWRHPGLQIDAANFNGETPLMLAALRGELGWCQRLVA